MFRTSITKTEYFIQRMGNHLKIERLNGKSKNDGSIVTIADFDVQTPFWWGEKQFDFFFLLNVNKCKCVIYIHCNGRKKSTAQIMMCEIVKLKILAKLRVSERVSKIFKWKHQINNVLHWYVCEFKLCKNTNECAYERLFFLCVAN